MSKQEKAEELIRAKLLIDECKYDEAIYLIKDFEEKGGHSLHDIVLCHLLNCELLFWGSLFEDAVKLTEQTYKESLGLGKNLLSVDILLLMAHTLLCLYQTDRSHDITKQGEELLKTLTQELPAEYKQREAYIAFLKGWAYDQKTETDPAIKQFELSVSLREELGVKKEIAWSLVGLAHVFMFRKGDYGHAFKLLKQSLAIAKESGNKYVIGYCLLYMAQLHKLKVDFDRSIIYFNRSLAISNSLNNIFMITRSLNSLGEIYMMRGELDHSIRVYEQSLELLKEINNKLLMADVFNSLAFCHKMKGELNHALESIEQSMAIIHELGTFNFMNNHFLIQILIDMGDLEQAELSLRDFEQLISRFNDKQLTSMYLLDKALLLKTSSRALNRGKAEEILRQILEEGDLRYGIKIETLLNLCELLLKELRITNDLEVLDELNQFISQLLELAEKSNSYWIQCETYLIQAKLSLLTFNIKKARRFLTQAYQIAKRFDLTQLKININNEKEELFKKLDLWEKLKQEDAPIADRMDLARLDEKIVKAIQNYFIQVSEEKISVSKERKICIVCRGEVLRFSYICNCGAIYCENCAQALIDLENVCWACEDTIDYTKPVKNIDKETEEIHVSKKHKQS